MSNWTEEAVALSGYDLAHLRRLLRAGRVPGQLKGGQWWIDGDAF